MSAVDLALRHIERYLGWRRPARRTRHHVIPGGSIDKRPPLPDEPPAPVALPPPPPWLTETAEDSLEGVKPLPAVEEICGTCGCSHAPERRRAWLATVEADVVVIIAERPCWYGDGEAGERRLFRDLKALREREVA